MDAFPDLGSLSDDELKELLRDLTLRLDLAFETERRIVEGKRDIVQRELVNRLRKKHDDPPPDMEGPPGGGAGVREPRRPIRPRGGASADL